MVEMALLFFEDSCFFIDLIAYEVLAGRTLEKPQTTQTRQSLTLNLCNKHVAIPFELQQSPSHLT